MLSCWRFWTPGPRAVGSVSGPPEDELSPPSLVGSLLPCVICNRTFLPEALARHQNICQKTAHKKRNVFSSSRQRLQGTGIDPAEVHRSPSPPLRRRSSSRSSWRDKHTQLLNTVRSARGAAPASSAPAVPVDYEQCPFCARHFGPKAADRHISWCQEQKSRINSSVVSAVAKNRLDARVKYQAPLPLKSRPKRLSGERLSRESSPAVSVASSAAVHSVRSPTRQTRDYAREYRERASQEREQRIQERKRSPAAVVSSGYGRQPASRLGREGSEPRTASPTKESFRRTQSFRTRPGAARGGLKHQRTAGSLRSGSSVQQQQRDEPDGGEDVQEDRHAYQRSTSNPAESAATHSQPGVSPSRPGQPFSAAEPERSERPERSPSPPPPPPLGDEAYITRSQLDEYQRLNDAVKQPEPEPLPSSPSSPGPGPPPSLDDLDASLTSERTSDGEGADTYRVTSGQVRRRLQQRGARRSGRSLSGQIELTVTALRPSPRRAAAAEAEEARPAPASAPAGVKPLRSGEEAPAAAARGAGGRRLPARSGETAGARQEAAREPREARTPEEVFADSLEDLITVSECPVLVKPKAVPGRGARPRGRQADMTPASGCVSLPALPPAPAPRPRPRPRRGPRLTLPPLEVRSGPPGGRTDHGSRHPHPPAPLARTLPPRRLSGAPADSPEPPAEGADPPPPPPPAWSEPPWRPIDDSNRSSNRSSVERNGGCAELQFPGLPLGGERDMSPSDSLYETEMPDFDLIMEEARRASERKNSALSPRKARMRGLDMREMMGVEVADLNLKNGGGGSGATTPRFCHECGSQYPVQAAKFCCQCGAQKLCV